MSKTLIKCGFLPINDKRGSVNCLPIDDQIMPNWYHKNAIYGMIKVKNSCL